MNFCIKKNTRQLNFKRKTTKEFNWLNYLKIYTLNYKKKKKDLWSILNDFFLKSALYIRQELSSIEIFSGSSFLSPSLFESNQNLVVITGSKSIWGFRGTSSTWSSFLIHIHSLTSVYAYKKLETSENSLFERLNKTYEQCRSNTGVIYFWIPRNNPPPPT